MERSCVPLSKLDEKLKAHKIIIGGPSAPALSRGVFRGPKMDFSGDIPLHDQSMTAQYPLPRPIQEGIQFSWKLILRSCRVLIK